MEFLPVCVKQIGSKLDEECSVHFLEEFETIID